MKKTLAILLTLALIFCMIPGSAFAANATVLSATVTLNNGDSETVYNGADQKPAVAVSVNNSPVSGAVEEWSAADIKNAGTYTVTVTGSIGTGESAQPYKGTATYIVRAIDLARATIVVSGDITEDNLNAGKTELNSYGNVRVMQDGVDITSYCDLTSKVTGSNVRITAEIKSDKIDNVNVIKSSKFADFSVKSTLSSYEIVSIAEQTYTGKAIEPYITVKSKTGYSTLVKGSHYTVSYANNVNAGSTASVTITGIGAYTGTLSGQFVIAQRPITSSDITVTVSDAAYNNGNPVYPDIVVLQGTTTLVKDVDYTVSTTGTSIGTGTAVITGIGNFKGQITRTFNIVDSGKALSYSNTWIYIGNSSTYNYSTYYNGQAQKPAVTVYIGATRETATLLPTNYYNVTYSDNIKPGFSARVTVTGKNGYAGSSFSYFTILETPLTEFNTNITGYNNTYAYDGTYHTPSVSVSVNGYPLKKGEDYIVTYSNNKNISTTYSKANIIITAIEGSGYTGTITKEFSIAGKSIAGCSAYFTTAQSSSSYTGSVIVPSITVKDGTYTTLISGIDYTVSYKDASGKVVTSMKEAGKYTVVITGKGNYSGELTLTYEVIGTDISNYIVTLKENAVKADGSSKKPSIASVKYGSSTLRYTDYEVSYLDSTGKEVTYMIAPGTYKVVVTGLNGYSGSTSAVFTIKGEPQNINVTKTSYKVYKDTDPFQISAKATGDGTGFSYISSDPTVASVSSTGVVTIHKIGRAKITVTTIGMKKSDPASEEVFVKVYPDKVTITKKPWTEGKKGSLRVRWDIQKDVTYYEVRYSRDKSFKTGTYKTKKVNASEKYDTQSTAIKELYSGKTYYVKVRAVKVVYNDYGQELKYYGKWSNWRSAKTK